MVCKLLINCSAQIPNIKVIYISVIRQDLVHGWFGLMLLHSREAGALQKEMYGIDSD